MNLEHKLRSDAETWLADGELSPEQSAALEQLVRRRRFRTRARWAGVGAAAAALLVAVMMGPMVVAVASGTPVVGPYIARMARYDEGAYWADQKGYVVPVGRSATARGVTLTIDSIVADAARTVIYYVVEGPGLDPQKGFPMFEIQFNKSHPTGGGSGRSEFVDGRIVGSLEWNGPLPTPVSVVDVVVKEIAGVKDDWSVSFMASRVELDRFARIIPVNRKLKGDGYDLTVTRVLLAPTETIVEVEGRIDPEVEVGPGAELKADGRVVNPHGASYTEGGTTTRLRLAFDRIDPKGVEQLAIRLTGLVRWLPGGPVLDLKPGARAVDGELWLEFLGVEQRENTTVVSARVPWNEPIWLKYQKYNAWVLVDAEGQQHEALIGAEPSGDGTARMQILSKAKVADPVQARALRYAVPVKGDLSVLVKVK